MRRASSAVPGRNSVLSGWRSMILRRLSQSLKQQNWTAIWIEFALLVAGVFLGIQVANWNEERADRALESRYLSVLKEDVVYSTGELQALTDHMEQQQAARKSLFEYAVDPKAAMEPDERDQRVLFGLFEITEVDIREVTFETLKSSGRLHLIRSPDLVSELQSLNANVAGALRIQADELQITYQFSDPLLIGHLDMASILRQPNLYGEKYIPWLKDAPNLAPTPDIMRTQPFANVLLYRILLTKLRLTSARNMLEQHRRIANLIEARQSEMGEVP